jgi:hypothetical protein
MSVQLVLGEATMMSVNQLVDDFLNSQARAVSLYPTRSARYEFFVIQ